MDHYVFNCNTNTEAECLERNLFGGTEGYLRYVKNVTTGTPLYLYNFETRQLHGGFIAASDISLNQIPEAWNGEYPLQVKVKRVNRPKPLSRIEVEDILHFNYRNNLPSTRIEPVLAEALDKRFASPDRINPEEYDFRTEHPASIRAIDGHLVRSLGEARIDDWLFNHDIPHGYECKLPEVQQTLFCDFFIIHPKTKERIYIEFWGLTSKKYQRQQKRKQDAYQKYELPLLELYPPDIKKLDEVLPRKLATFGIKIKL